MPATGWLTSIAIGAAVSLSLLTGAHAQVKEAAAPAATRATRTPAPAEAYVYIGWPNDGEVLRTRRFKVWFGTRNFGVAPAGVTKANTGHHHLLIDTALPPLDEPIPNDKNHLHFGAGQTEAKISLPLGQHKLRLLFADEAHVPHDPPVYSNEITVIVNATGRRPPPPRPRPFRGRHYRA
jgi:hypothetical protein